MHREGCMEKAYVVRGNSQAEQQVINISHLRGCVKSHVFHITTALVSPQNDIEKPLACPLAKNDTTRPGAEGISLFLPPL